MPDSRLTWPQRIVNNYPDLDCVFLNSGVQNLVHLSKPESVDLDAFHEQMSTNFSRMVDLSIKFLPHLQKKPHPTALIFTGTLLAHVPAVVMSAYSASKAALSAYANCLRRENAGTSTKIIEIWPPAVQSKWPSGIPARSEMCQSNLFAAELHDYMGPEVGRSLGMPVAQFVEKAWVQIVSGTDHIIVGALGPEEPFLGSVRQRREQFEALSDQALAHFGQ